MEKVLDLMTRINESVNYSDNYWDYLISDNPIVIKEGLIKSYDSEMVFKAICQTFHLRNEGKERNFILLKLKGEEYTYLGSAFLDKQENGEDIIKIKLDYNEDFIKTIIKRFEKYGWSLYRDDKDLDGKTIFYFEKKFPTKFIAEKLNKIGVNYLYHVAPKKIKKKILKQGLIPKESKTPGFYNEPRIFLWLLEEDAYYWFNNNNIINQDKILIQIDIRKLNPTHNFFVDGRLYDTLYVKDPIPNNAIKIIEE